MSFAFAGTPRFAAWMLRDLAEIGVRPALVISQPGRPQGRGRKVGEPAAFTQATLLGLDCTQTDDINAPVVVDRLRDLGLSILVVAAFGQLLRRPLLDAVMCMNVHGSLLPSYRGAAPIETALTAGETMTGVSIMRVTEGLDEGPWAQQTCVQIGLRDDAGSLARVLSFLGAAALAQVLDAVADGTVVWNEQEGPPSYAPKLEARDCMMDPTFAARGVHDRVRALSPWTGARAVCGDLAFKVWRTWPYGQPGLPAVPGSAKRVAGSPGDVVAADGRLFVGCAEGVVEVLAIQPANRARMTASAFLRGYGDRLGGCVKPVEPVDGPENWL